MISNSIVIILPEISILTGIILIIFSSILFNKYSRISYFIAQLTITVALLLLLYQHSNVSIFGFNKQIAITQFNSFLRILLCAVSFFAFLYGKHYVLDKKLPISEYYILSLVVVIGGLVTLTAYSLLMVYIGIELLSLPFYALIAISRYSQKSSESAIKYFILSSIASGFMLYGMSFIYGMTGSLTLDVIADNLSIISNNVLNDKIILVSIILLLVGLLFKLGIFPFHLWVADVYQGAPNSVMLFLSTIPKIVILGLLIAILTETFSIYYNLWSKLLFTLSLCSIFIGNLMALVQKNIKRMLGFSTVSHMGFILLSLGVASNDIAFRTTIYYGIVYILMILVMFGIITALGVRNHFLDNLSDFKGLNKQHPWISFLILITMFSMAGIPPFAGFLAKLFVISGLINEQYYNTAIFILIMSIIGSFYYIRVVKYVYFDNSNITTCIYLRKSTLIILSFNVLLILLLGLFPEPLISFIGSQVNIIK